MNWLIRRLGLSGILTELRRDFESTDTKTTNPCLLKADEFEPLWVVRAQDRSAARQVLHWLVDNIDHISEAKARAAFENAMLLKRWPLKKEAD